MEVGASLQSGFAPMYLRHTTVRKNGKTHSYWRLVRSVPSRPPSGAGDGGAASASSDRRGRARAGALALRSPGGKSSTSCLRRRPEGADTGCSAAADHVRPGARPPFWRRVAGLAAVARPCSRSFLRGPSGRRPRAGAVAGGRGDPGDCALVRAGERAAHCRGLVSPHGAGRSFQRVGQARQSDDRLYRALDRLLPHKQALETHLKERLGTLFDLDYELLLYDVTSTYFEGQAEGNGLARRGYGVGDHGGD